ncbi:MAG: DUF488 family protein [candidate division WOR-3 bacterium]
MAEGCKKDIDNHDPANWEEFKRRYFAELETKPESWQLLIETIRKGTITLPFSTRDKVHNSAVALKGFLKAKF